MTTDPTPAEIEAGAEALELAMMRDAVPWAETVRDYPRLADEIRRYAGAMLRAVLPDHDARVRADERRRVAEEIARAIEATNHHPDTGCECDAQDAQALAAGTARAHTTEGDTDA